MATRTPFEVISHTRRVCSVYKKCLKSLQDWTPDRALLRYRCALVRGEFDKNRNVKNIHEAVKLVEFAEHQQDMYTHYSPFTYPTSPGGIDHGRYVIPPDWVLDFYDPIEKAKFPEFFKLREQRKREYIARWEAENGKIDPNQNAAAH